MQIPNQEQVTVPWHQDNACKIFYLTCMISLFLSLDLNKECWNVLQVTAWIPLLDVNKENGIIYLSKVIIMIICIYFLKDVYKYYVVDIV